MKDEALYEELSRLLAGELTAERSAALLQRVDRDPEVAAVWEGMCALPGSLADMPELAPPAELDALVLDAVEAVEQDEPSVASSGDRSSGYRGAVGWLVAAAAVVVAMLWPAAEPPQMILAEGSQWVDGHALVYAGDQVVEVDGAAMIQVEPLRRDLRVVGVQTEDAMQKRDVLMGALAGAVVTVAVMEGSARIWPAKASAKEAVAVPAGQSRTVGIRRTDEGLKLEVGTPPEGETAEEAIVRLTAERDALAEELATSRFEGAMAKGQLAAHQGEPIPWDDSVPAKHRPEAVEEGIDAFLDEHPDIELADLDCAEFPCIATFRPIAEDADPMDAARELPKQYASSLFGEGSAVMASVMATEGEDGRADHLVSVAAVPEDRKDGEWATRAQYRTETISNALMGAPGGDGEATEDVEIH